MRADPVAVSPVPPSSGTWPSHVKPTSEFLAAHEYLREGKGHLFVTGRAGTGKSTLLKCLRDLLEDKMVVVAPTGLAAVNVGGQTIHSFFGLPPRLIRKDDIRRSRNARIMRKLKFVVVDEVSMVRSDLMWAIDQSLRINRGQIARAVRRRASRHVRRPAPAAARGQRGRDGGAPGDGARRAVLL